MNPNETVAIAAPPMRSDGGFDYQNTGTRVVLAPNAVDDLAALVSPLGCERLMVICGPNTRRSLLFARVLRSLGARVAMILDQVPQHSSTTLVTEAARKARAASVDGLVAVGGGSASDTAKGVAILLGEGGVIEEHASSFTPLALPWIENLHRAGAVSATAVR